MVTETLPRILVYDVHNFDLPSFSCPSFYIIIVSNLVDMLHMQVNETASLIHNRLCFGCL